MKKLLLTCAAVAFISCGPDVDLETRIQAKIQVVDSQGQPVPRATASIEVDQNDDGWNSGSLLEMTADQNGKFYAVFAAPSHDDTPISFYVYGNFSNPDGTQSGYEPFVIKGLTRTDFIDYTFPVSQAVLYKAEDVTDLNVETVFESPGYDQYVVGLTASGNFSSTIYFDPATPIYGATYRVLKNQVVTLHYFIKNTATGESTEHSESVPINGDPVTYTINL